MKWILIIILILSICAGCNMDTKELSHGELMDKKENCIEYDENVECIKKVFILKAKIQSSYNNNATVNQNFINVYDYIKRNFDESIDYDELQYWAVADMNNGKEEKAVSFTVNKTTIMDIITGKIESATLIADNVEDLYIHSSLKK